MAWLSEGERRARVQDSTRDRTVLINQILLAGVTLIAVLFALGLNQVTQPTSFLVGVVLIFGAAAAAVLIPWRQVPTWVSGILPVADIVAIGFLRESAPTSGVGLLWAFPAMWIGATFGIPGVVLGSVGISLSLWILTAIDPAQTLSASTVLLPITITALATISHLSSRRAHAQRGLLEKQSVHLQRSVDRARRQEDLVTEVLDAVDFGVIRITPEGELVVTNEAHARLQGSAETAGEEIPAFAADGTSTLDHDSVPLARARRGETFENELVWYGVAGEGRRALTVTARALTEIDGSAAGSIVVSRDVTSEEQALRAREDLVASVSHELRTPLTSIIGYLELSLDDPEVPERVRTDLEIAERNAGRLLELVTDILSMSTVSRHGVDLALHREPVDVAAIAEAAAQSARQNAAERSIQIDTSRLQTTWAAVDAHRLRQVLDNLVSNAIKYGHDGGYVRLEVTGDGVHAWIAVSDDGSGISDEEQPLLFERFFRSDSVRNSTTHGSGLGLAISRDIIRAHGGDILVHTRAGRGSTFTVRVPVAVEEDA